MSSMQKVVLYDSTTIDQFQWPLTEDGQKARGYLYPLIKEGISSYLLNVSTRVLLISDGNLFLPLTVNEREYENSYIASNYYALKFYEESISKKHPLLLQLQKPFLFLGKNCLKLIKINRTIFLNNWLMTNSLAPKISHQELRPIVDFLKKEFPTHTIIFRHVDVAQKRELLNALKMNQFHLLRTREVFLYDPQDKIYHSSGVRKMIRRDSKVLKKYNFTIVPSDEVQEDDYPRILALYEMLYMGKYTKYSPQYTQKFIKMTHQNKMVNYVLLKREGVMEGFFSYFIFNGAMINCLFGYDVTLPHSHQIYKVLTRLVLNKAEELGVVMNDGSGGDAAKEIRGMKATTEYMGLYSAHLPLLRRLLWNSVAFFYKKFTPQQEMGGS